MPLQYFACEIKENFLSFNNVIYLNSTIIYSYEKCSLPIFNRKAINCDPNLFFQSYFQQFAYLFIYLFLFLLLFVIIPLFSPSYCSFSFPSLDSHLLSHGLNCCLVIVCCIKSLLLSQVLDKMVSGHVFENQE